MALVYINYINLLIQHNIILYPRFSNHANLENGLKILYISQHFVCKFWPIKYANEKRQRKWNGNIFIKLHLSGIRECDIFGCGFLEPPPPMAVRIANRKGEIFGGPIILSTFKL